MRVLSPVLIGLALVLTTACYEAPDLPLVDDVPIVPISSTCAPQRSETVRCTLDGDTFTNTDCLSGSGEHFRMLGIDTPEIAHEPEPADCYGNEAKLELQEILQGERATLTFDQDCIDIYERTLTYVWLNGEAAEDLIEMDPNDAFDMPEEEGEEAIVFINEWMLAKGFARVYDSAPDPLSELLLGARLQSAENRAKNQGLGLWDDCSN